MEQLLTTRDVAEKLQVSVSAIYKWVDEKRIPYIDLGMEGRRRCLRFRVKDIERLLDKNSMLCYSENGNSNRLVERKN